MLYAGIIMEICIYLILIIALAKQQTCTRATKKCLWVRQCRIEFVNELLIKLNGLLLHFYVWKMPTNYISFSSFLSSWQQPTAVQPYSLCYYHILFCLFLLTLVFILLNSFYSRYIFLNANIYTIYILACTLWMYLSIILYMYVKYICSYVLNSLSQVYL